MTLGGTIQPTIQPALSTQMESITESKRQRRHEVYATVTETELRHPTAYWHALTDGRVQCDVCPRECKMHDGQRGMCFVCGAELGSVLETLEYPKRETRVWFEITTLLVPGENDSEAELHAMTEWIAQHLGPDVPLHFTAFHPDWKMTDKKPTPPGTLTRAREIALEKGLRYVYTGSVYDPKGSSTYCPGCHTCLIERDGYDIGAWQLDTLGRCEVCAAQLPGVFVGAPGSWVAKRMPVRMS